MVSYVQIEGLTKSYGDRLLFADVTLGIYEGDKIGLIAPNGTGKSTLLSIINGDEEADSGSVIFRNGLRVGFLPQTSSFSPEQTLLSFMTEKIFAHEEENPQARALSMITSMRLPEAQTPMHSLSGGEVKRAAIARLILSEPDFILLDEPTNHLDIDMIEWLENYLTRSRATMLMVTHDRYFLDRVCNKIVEIDRQQIYTYKGNYDYYLEKRQERREAIDAEMARVRNLLHTELEWMRRQPQARGSKAKYRIDNFYELEKKSQQGNPRENSVQLSGADTYIGSKIFEAKHISKSWGDKLILQDWNYIFARYDKVGIVGDNGVGKSTLIKMLLGEVQPDSGSFDIGITVRFGYYSQKGMEFNQNMKVIDAVRDIAETVRIDEKTTLTASQFLTRFLFTPATQQNFVYKLSGGERRRLYLATVLMRSPNFLILDEPTNDLDIPTLAILEEYIASFKGCLLVVSHDRYFLDRVTEHLFVMTGDGGIRDFPGDYSTYRHCLQAERKEKAARENTAKQQTSGVKPKVTERPVKLSYKETKELEALQARLPELEEEKLKLEAEMSSGTLTPEQLQVHGERIRQLIEEIDEKEMRALELMEKQ
ncbi:MAG: ABC-F family ATP-binding cassette domain-containing protein [Prevotella sp.]|nr:ABC-F family ATP-binding cassette domain-containing protein [Prevotella sp.]MCM1074466.1 ABC-F family ATP-binding cassette domain-containing protein [Ruminococcus sp.]